MSLIFILQSNAARLVLAASTFLILTTPAVASPNRDEQDGLKLEHAKVDLSDRQYEKAYARFSNVARHGHAQAQHIAGMMCENGCGTKKNMSRAVAYYRRAAAQGCAESECKLGHMYLVGNEVLKKDTHQAVEWLERAANHNNPQAQHTLGKLYAAGGDVPQDLAKAGRWLKAAAANGIKDAEQALANLPQVPMPGGSGQPNPLGVAGQNYGTGLKSVQQAWGGYGDVINTLNSASTSR